MLNAALCQADFYKLKKSEQVGFKKFRVVTVPKGTLLFKITAGSADSYDGGKVTPWWSAVKPLLDDKEGALGRYQQAKDSNMNMSGMVRVMSCVCLDWNDLDNYVQVELQDDIKVFWGTFAPMPKFSEPIYVWRAGWKDLLEENTPLKTLKKVKDMQLKEKKAGFKVPDMLGGAEAWQMYIPNLKEEHIKRKGIIPGHDMHALGLALGC